MAEPTSLRSTATPRLRPPAVRSHAPSTPGAAGVWAWIWLAVLPGVAALYTLRSTGLTPLVSSGLDLYLIQPMGWLGLALLSTLGRRLGLAQRAAHRRGALGLAASCGLLHLSLLVLAAVALGFGRSPYGRTPLVLLGNVWYAAAMLVGMESCRAYLVEVFSHGSGLIGLLAPSLLLAGVSIPAGQFTGLIEPESVFRLTGGLVVPALSESLLASALAWVGGPSAALVYRGLLQAFEWLSPVLPRLSWPAAALVGALGPGLGLWLVERQAQAGARAAARQGAGGASWALVAALSVLALWFNLGLFGVRPTLVSGASMLPALRPGDIVITRPLAPEAVRQGMIVRFRQGESVILHRVIEVAEGAAGWQYVTRGDANNVDDSPIGPHQLEGEVVLVVPYAGWPAIAVRALLGLAR